MKKMIRLACLFIAIMMFFTSPVLAEERSVYSNSFIASYDSFITVPYGNTLNIWFDVVGNGEMDEIGSQAIWLERSSNRTDWTTIRIFQPDDYPQMISTNTGIAYDYVSCNVTGGFFYRAYVKCYAKNSRGIGVEYDYSETMYMPRPSEPVNVGADPVYAG